MTETIEATTPAPDDHRRSVLGTATATVAFKAIGYAIEEIAGALEDVFNFVAEEVGVVLKAIGYALEEIAGVLQDLFNLAQEALTEILEGIGFLLSEIEQFFDDLGDALCEFFGDIC